MFLFDGISTEIRYDGDIWWKMLNTAQKLTYGELANWSLLKICAEPNDIESFICKRWKWMKRQEKKEWNNDFNEKWIEHAFMSWKPRFYPSCNQKCSSKF